MSDIAFIVAALLLILVLPPVIGAVLDLLDAAHGRDDEDRGP